LAAGEADSFLLKELTCWSKFGLKLRPACHADRGVKVGLDVNAAPKTLAEVWATARTIKQSGAATCGYTSTLLT